MNGSAQPASAPDPDETNSRRQELALLGLVLLLALVVRLWLIQVRWVGPDEGAHLMDGQLILDGLVPVVDFGSRGVIYAYLTSLAVWIIGTDLFHLRYFPVAITLASGVVIYLIGRHTLGWRAGLGAAALFLLLPFSALMTIQTKTEPLAILSSASAMYFLMRAHTEPARRLRWLFVSGLSVGIAFYIRESTLAVLGALMIVIVLDHGRQWVETLRSSAALLLGMAAVTALVGVFYLRFFSLSQILSIGSLNPIAFVAETLGVGQVLSDMLSTTPSPPPPIGVIADAQGLMGVSTLVVESAQESFARADRLDLSTSVENFTRAAWASAVLGFGAMLAAVLLVVRLFRDRTGDWLYTYGLPLTWAGCVALAYGLWTVKRGFYPAYFLELTPPLAIVSAASLSWCWRQLPAHWSPRIHLAALASLTGVFGVIHVAAGTRQISLALYFLVSALVLAVYLLPGAGQKPTWGRAGAALGGITLVGIGLAIVIPQLPWVQGLALGLASIAGVLGALRLSGYDMWRESRASALSHAGYAVMAAGLFIALSDAAANLSLRFHSVWTPETVREVSRLLEEQTDPEATVISGAVIWELQAKRAPFANVSHPLGFLAGMSDAKTRILRDELRTSPPAAIVLDSRTEQTYLTVLPELEDLIREQFQLVATITGSAFPVSLYVAAPRPPAAAGVR